jgi:hypothetical protein
MHLWKEGEGVGWLGMIEKNTGILIEVMCGLLSAGWSIN